MGDNLYFLVLIVSSEIDWRDFFFVSWKYFVKYIKIFFLKDLIFGIKWIMCFVWRLLFVVISVGVVFWFWNFFNLSCIRVLFVFNIVLFNFFVLFMFMFELIMFMIVFVFLLVMLFLMILIYRFWVFLINWVWEYEIECFLFCCFILISFLLRVLIIFLFCLKVMKCIFFRYVDGFFL